MKNATLYSCSDLIDTLWNVKTHTRQFSTGLRLDLIDTLWNVKFIAILSARFPLFGFNRYIVECKAAAPGEQEEEHHRFNRYIVECKVKENIDTESPLGDLIDTLWNVKRRGSRSRFRMSAI